MPWGTGPADDKSVYPLLPEMIRFYLGEWPIPQNVPTWLCRKEDDLKYVLDHLHELVVKGSAWCRWLRYADRAGGRPGGRG